MYRLLIVDDEQDIADSLYELFRDFDSFDLDVYRVYSGIEALEKMSRTKIDIVLTDIRMPGMSGLQLMEQIRGRWPECQIIFLTGHQEFEYVYTAINNDNVRYLLKMEGHEQIVNAVRSAIAKINENRQIGDLLAQANSRLNASLPALQQAFIMDLLLDSAADVDPPGQFEQLQIPLDAGAPVLLIACKANRPGKRLSRLDGSQLVHAVHNVFVKYLHPTVRSVPIAIEALQLVWLVQPCDRLQEERHGRHPAEWTLSSIRGNLETVQEVCYESLGVSLSVVMDGEYTAWASLPARFQAMRDELQEGTDRELALKLLDNRRLNANDVSETSEDERIVRSLPGKLRQMEHDLDAGQAEAFQSAFQPLLHYLREKKTKDHRQAIEVYYSVALLLSAYMNKKQLADQLPPDTDPGRLLRADVHAAWRDAADYLAALANHLFEMRSDEQQDRANAVIRKVQQYIMSHLGEEISLIRLAEIVHFNPSYLSRIFKQITGDNLSSYINSRRLDKAKELLADHKHKIHEIAAMLGFSTAPYFTRFFKKMTGMSPQEYRDQSSQ